MLDSNNALKELCANINNLKANTCANIGIEVYMPAESIYAVNITGISDEPCVCGACVMCQNAAEGSTPVHMLKDGKRVELGGLAELNKKDILMDKPFAGCETTEDKICGVKAEDIEDEEWQDVDETKSQGKDKETLKSQSSYMVCTKGWGLIYFVNAGQQLKDFADGLSTFMDHLQEQFGFDRRTVGVMAQIYRKIPEKFPEEKDYWDWRFARSLSQMADYDNKVNKVETDAWVKGAGKAMDFGKDNHQSFFCDELGIDEADYIYMRQMVRLQHYITSNDDYSYNSVYEMSTSFFKKGEFKDWKETMEEAIGEELSNEEYLEKYEEIYDRVSPKGDFSHMLYTISANLIDDGYGVQNEWDNNLASIMSWDNAEQRKDITGWLGDAIYGGTTGKISFGQDDFIADLDADNIAHLVTDDKSLVDAANEYYNELQNGGEEYRKQVFVENNTYEAIESAIMEKLSMKDMNKDKEINYKDIEDSRLHKETYEFLKQLAPYSEGQSN